VSQPSTLLGALNSVIGFPQAVLLASDEGINPAGVLRSAGVTPFHRYYGPLRLPTGQDDGYWFPSSLDLSSYPDNRSPRRVSQVPCRSFDARCPVSPRGVRPLHLLVASRPISGFDISGRLATPIRVTRPKGSLALRLTSSRSQAPTKELPPPPLGPLHGERAIPMVSTSQLTRSAKLS
jgi:hypothetical protein